MKTDPTPCIRLIVSCSHLRFVLSKIDFETDRVHEVHLKNKGELIITTAHGSELLILHVESVGNRPTKPIFQEDRRWDWVYNLMQGAGDQPITLEIWEAMVKVSFHY